MTDDQINNIFTYHRPFADQPLKYEVIRETGKKLANTINNMCPDSREKSLAITRVQEAIMWANAAIAINEKEIK